MDWRSERYDYLRIPTMMDSRLPEIILGALAKPEHDDLIIDACAAITAAMWRLRKESIRCSFRMAWNRSCTKKKNPDRATGPL